MEGPASTDVLAYAAQIAVAAVLVAAALPKMRDPRSLQRTLDNYAILPVRAVPAAARGLVSAEMLAALALVSGYAVMFGLVLAASLLGAFSVGISVNLRRRRHIDCGCFGSNGDTISRRSLMRIALLSLAVVALLATGASELTLGDLLSSRESLRSLIESVGLAAFLILSATWLLTIPELVRALRPANSHERPKEAELST